MPRLCERPGCSQPADVAYGFDAGALTVWLDRLEVDLAPRGGVLCRRHADAMVVPLGWMLDDRREPVPQLFRTKAADTETAAPAPHPRRRSRQRPGDDTVQLRLDAIALEQAIARAEKLDREPGVEPAHRSAARPDAADAPDDAPGAELVEEPVHDDPDPTGAWMPRFDQEDDLGGLLRPRGSLLSRAFHGGRPEPR